MKDELDDLLANELPTKDLDYVSPQNSYTHCRMAWTNKHTGVKNFDRWIPINRESYLNNKVENLNEQNSFILYWIERTTF